MRKFKIITQIDRINYFSDTYLNYYMQIFDKDEFYFMIYYKNADEIKDYLYSKGFNYNNVETYNVSEFGHGGNISRQNGIKNRFLSEGRIVVYADIDEMIYHHGDLKQYIINENKPYIVATGMVIMQGDNEPPIDTTKKVLEQRSLCKVNCEWFSKTCILQKDFRWGPGRHDKPVDQKPDPNIYLFDLSRICKNIIEKNNEISRKLYKKVHPRYAASSAEQVLSMWTPFLPYKTDVIPEEIKITNRF